MHALEIGSSADDPGLPADAGAQPCLVVHGAEGSSLRATPTALVVCPSTIAAGPDPKPERIWPYDQLRAVRLDERGPLAVIRGTIRATGAELPLLLVEGSQLAAARHALAVLANLIDRSKHEDDPA